MFHEEQFVPYRNIIVALRKYCEKRSSGTLFITTQENSAVRFVLKNGDIISMAQGRERGLNALKTIRTMQRGRYKFSSDIVYSVDGKQELPKTLELIDLLFGVTQIPTKIVNNHNQITEIDASINRIVQADSNALSIQHIRSVIEFELVENIGPMGAVICDEYFSSIQQNPGRQSIERLVEAIADEIGSSAFKQNVDRKLFAL